jgi:zinc and cadmium transporter
MSNIWLYSLVSVVIVSLISLIGAVTLAVNHERLKQYLLYLVSFSAGALLGDVFLHILPEMAESSFGLREGVYILLGILIFFILERYILWHHSHSEHSEEIHSSVYLTQIGDSLHNFIDGMIIAGSFLASVQLGIATTIAVIFHEIPQEIGNFAILVHGGWSKLKALWYNFLSALTAVLGAIVVLMFVKTQTETPSALLSLGVASFIYIAMSDIIPQLHEEKNPRKSGLQLLWFIVGIVAMALLLLLE